jgi:phosphoribosylformylglycinamidine cyclo-ligase
MKDSDVYENLGVSASKTDVHNALKGQDKGIFPGAFCKILPDISGDPKYCSIFHSDSAGTKANLAYMMYKETGKLSYFKGIVQDAIIMNVDDVLCVGVSGNTLISDTISRNKYLISGEVLSVLINHHISFCDWLSSQGFSISLAGGETEDVGDICRTLEVGVSLFTRMERSQVIDASRVMQGDVIVGLASSGQAIYESSYNSGISSNGLTLARHGTLSHKYYKKFPECYDPNLEEKLVFHGKYDLLDKLEGTSITIGDALLSPTRTYAPILVEILSKYRAQIHGIYHNTGGGQTKCLNFGKNLRYIKDNLFEIPPVFSIIQDSSRVTWKEMYQVFNMGHRMEILVPENISQEIVSISKKFGVEAQVVGRVEPSKEQNGKNTLLIKTSKGEFRYTK